MWLLVSSCIQHTETITAMKPISYEYCVSQTNEANYGELHKLKLILWGTEVPMHNMTALPAQEVPEEDEMDLVCMLYVRIHAVP